MTHRMVNPLMMSLLLLIFPSLSQALNVSGYVCYRTSGYLGIKIAQSDNCLMVVFDNEVAQEDFQQLEIGDGLTFSGTYEPLDMLMTIESVDTVLLNRILGNWRDEYGRYYNFDNFSTLYRYDPNKPRNYQTESFMYSLYPNGENTWSILIENREITRVGKLIEYRTTHGVLQNLELCLLEGSESSSQTCSLLKRLSN